MATSWALQSDGRTWRFSLRRGVTFHDGAPFAPTTWYGAGASARARDGPIRPPPTASTTGHRPGGRRGQKIDDFTVDFTPITPNLRLPEQIVHPEGAIVKNGTHNDTPPYAGTGAYRYVSYVERQTAVFERNDNYWGEKPKIKRFEIQFIPDPVARINALKSGQVDFVYDLPADTINSLEGDPTSRSCGRPRAANRLI